LIDIYKNIKPRQVWNALFNHSDPPAFGNDQEEKGLGNEITNNSFINARHNLRFSTGYAGLPQGIIQTPETENR